MCGGPAHICRNLPVRSHPRGPYDACPAQLSNARLVPSMKWPCKVSQGTGGSFCLASAVKNEAIAGRTLRACRGGSSQGICDVVSHVEQMCSGASQELPMKPP